MKKILGLDIGTNSIGAALINLPEKFEDYGKEGSIEWVGSRIIPIDGDYLQKFESGAQAETKAAARRQKRGSRRLKHRYKLRRSRLIKVFKTLGWLNKEFPLDDSRQFKQDINENGYSFKISDYLPFSIDTVAEFEDELGIKGSKSKKGNSIVPEDWIIYYLRKKALSKKIEIQELIRIIYMLNQRRGFKSSRKDLNTTNVLPLDEFNKRKETKQYGEEGIETQFVSITKVRSVTFKEEKKDRKGSPANVFTIEAEDNRMQPWEETRWKEPEWIGKEFTFLVTQKIDKNGKFIQNKPQIPKDDDWGLCTTALGEKIQENNHHPGEYFYDQIKAAFKAKRNFKARQYPVHRWRYQKELKTIWEKQCDLNPELAKVNTDQKTLVKLAEILYPTQARYNMPKLAEFRSHNLLYVISNDIIYYQRELKSQKNSINECRYEKRIGIDGEYYGLKCIPRSSPMFQEFRIWQDIHNIRIFKKESKNQDGKTKIDVDVTAQNIDETVKEKLFDLFNSKASISESDILKLLQENVGGNDIIVNKSDEKTSHRINLFANRDSLKGNETLSRYRTLFKKAEFDGESVLNNSSSLIKLWHADYSITSSDEEKSKKGITAVLTRLLPENPNKEKVIELFVRLGELKKEYGSYSACAIKKMLPVMRCGKYWSEQDVPDMVMDRAGQIIERLDSIHHNLRKISEIADDDVQKQVLKSFMGRADLTKNLNTYQAGYLVYDKHSEKDITLIKSVEEFGKYIQKAIPNNSLRNPIVEQVVRETMLLVRDIWKEYGEIAEVHIELGRELKNNSDQRKKVAEIQKGNFDEKQRIKKLLYELINEGFDQYNEDEEVENTNFEVNPNPESPVDVEKFRIWRSLSKQSDKEWEKKVKDEKIPTDQEIKKYALWLSQNCRSPYTGKIIPLSKLFDKAEYEIEHAIPRSKMKNDGFNNLVITEAAINPKPYKGDMLARNFIAQFGGKNGKEYEINGRKYFILGEEEYEYRCKETFKFQKSKLKNLLATEVPEDFVDRQLNDTRYIGRKLSELLAPIVANENGVIFTGGAITSELKRNWGLNSIWKELVKPRFERLEKITGKRFIVPDEQDANKYHFDLSDNPQLDLKRIDHRHHALDAIIIAATTREHIRYLNTLSAADSDEEIQKYKRALVKRKIRDFKQPWDGFSKQAKEALEHTIVSFKINNRIITTPKNRTAYWKTANGKAVKAFKDQKSNPRWMAVRKSMFKEPLGIKWIKETKDISVKEAFSVEIERQLIDNDPEKRKTASYVYDKHARRAIKEVINRCDASIDEKEALLREIDTYLKKNSRKAETGKINKKGKNQNKTVYLLDGVEYEVVRIAQFITYKTKRMSLTKKEYVEKLTIEKMKGDFPYFSQDEQRNNAFNNLFFRHIKEYDNDPKEAFSAEGIESLNKKALENTKIAKEIKSITRLDGTVSLDDMFNGGFYETDKGANIYFVMYENQDTKEREGFQSVATHKAIERIVKGQSIAKEREGFDIITLSPGDLVYVPTIEEREKLKVGIDPIDWNNKANLSKSIYKMTDTTQGKCLFIPHRISSPIGPDSLELGSSNKSARAWDGQVEYVPDSKGKLSRQDTGTMIKDVCIKLKVDRLGNISKA